MKKNLSISNEEQQTEKKGKTHTTNEHSFFNHRILKGKKCQNHSKMLMVQFFFFILVSFLIPFYLICFVWANASYNRMEVTEHQCHTLTRLFYCWINFDNFLRIRLNECNDAIWFCIYTVCMRVWTFIFCSFWFFHSFIRFTVRSTKSNILMTIQTFYRLRIGRIVCSCVCVCASWLVLLFCRSCSCHRRCRRV